MKQILEKIKSKAPISVKIDAGVNTIPKEILDVEFAIRWRTPNAIRAAMITYSKIVIDGIKDLVPAVTIPTNRFAIYGAEGIDAMIKISQYASDAGLLVIEDCNITAATSEELHDVLQHRLEISEINELKQRVYFNDMITVNPYSTPDVFTVAIHHAKRTGKVVLINIKPSSDIGIGDAQVSVPSVGTMPVYQEMCERIKNLNIVDESGFSLIGVSATFKNHSTELIPLRMKYPNIFIYAANLSNLTTIASMLNHDGCIADTAAPFKAHLDPSYQGLYFSQAANECAKDIIASIKGG